MTRPGTGAKLRADVRGSGPAPLRYRDEHGTQRLFGRRPGWVFEERDGTGNQVLRLYCPAGHRVDLEGIPVKEQLPVRCEHREREGAPECGITLLLVGGVGARDGTRAVMVLEVTLDELRWMERHQLATVEDELRYLGNVPARAR